MKKFIAILLCFTTAFSLAACGSKPDAEPSVPTEAVAESTGEVTQTAANPEYIQATFEDIQDLVDLSVSILFNCPHSDDFGYDSSSGTAPADAMYIIQNNSGGLYYENIVLRSEGFNRYEDTYPADPLKKFVDSFGYYKVNADDADWILENVLCIKPDRTKTSDDFDKTAKDYYGCFNYYYYDGYYYYEYEEGGGGWGPMSLTDCSRQPDGSYLIKMSTIYSERIESELERGKYEYSDYVTSAALKYVDGQKVWSVSYTKKTSDRIIAL